MCTWFATTGGLKLLQTVFGPINMETEAILPGTLASCSAF
jgi:hypothetical protein